MVNDVAYLVRPGETNPELRYSLRSLRHLPHGRVWIAGHRPRWVRDVEHLDVRQERLSLATKRDNAWRNLRAVAEHPDITGTVTYMDDDYFVLAPHPDGLPVLNGGPLRAQAEEYARRFPRSHYTALLRLTVEHLAARGYPDPLTFDLHVPLEVDRSHLTRVMDDLDATAATIGGRTARPLWRTVYATTLGLTGRTITDVKVRPGQPLDTTAALLSTADTTWRTAEPHLRRTFPRAGRHER